MLRNVEPTIPRYASRFSLVTILGSAGAIGTVIKIAGATAGLSCRDRGGATPRHEHLNRQAELIPRNTVLPVRAAETVMDVEPCTVYVAPPSLELVLEEDGTWLLRPAAETDGSFVHQLR